MELEQKTGKVLNTPARVNQVLSKYGLMNENSRLDAAAVVELESVFIDVEVKQIMGKIKFKPRLPVAVNIYSL